MAPRGTRGQLGGHGGLWGRKAMMVRCMGGAVVPSVRALGGSAARHTKRVQTVGEAEGLAARGEHGEVMSGGE